MAAAIVFASLHLNDEQLSELLHNYRTAKISDTLSRETELPESVRLLREQVRRADAVLLVTPEYNRSYSPVMKNALDWASRPSGQNCWAGKPAAIAGCTPYTLGAFGAVHHLRQVLTYL